MDRVRNVLVRDSSDAYYAWIVVAPDDTVTIRIGQTELGQGVWTACAMMIAATIGNEATTNGMNAAL